MSDVQSALPPGTAGASEAPRAHDRIYSLLVESEDDLVGLIAYSLYKRNKVAYIESFVRDHGRAPDEQQLAEVRRSFSLPAAREGLRAEAEKVLATFTGGILNQALEDAEANYQDKIKEQAQSHSDELIRKLSEAQPYWKTVRQNIWANIATVILGVLLVIVVWGAKYGPKELIETIFDVKVTANLPRGDAAQPK